MHLLSIAIILILIININAETLWIDDSDLSMSVNSEMQISFSMNTINAEWCLFYNFNDISNHLYCTSSSTNTECHTLNDKHYIFRNISLCNINLSSDNNNNNNSPSLSLPIVGRFNEKYICDIYYNLCCKLNNENEQSEECIVNTNNENKQLFVDFLLPLNNDVFLNFAFDRNNALSMSCVGTNDPNCNEIPEILPTFNVILLDSIFISDNVLLILFTDHVLSSLFIQKCSIFVSNSQCKTLSDVTFINENNKKLSVIAYNECNLVISIMDKTYLYLYNHCDEILNKINIRSINDENIYNPLNNYITNYRIPNLYNLNQITCFILFENEFIINCLSVNLETISPPTTHPTIRPTVQLNYYPVNDNNNNNNNIESEKNNTNSIGAFSDASFITIVVVGGIVFISCLICGVICFTKYQKEKIRQEWYKERQKLRKQKRQNKKRYHSKTIIPPNGSEFSICSNTMNTMNTMNGNYTESEYEESTIKLNDKSKYLNKQRINSNSSSFIRAKSYPRLPPKYICSSQKDEKEKEEEEEEDHEADEHEHMLSLPLPPPPPPPMCSSNDCNYRKDKERKTSISHRSLNKYDEQQEEGTYYNSTYSTGDVTPLEFVDIVIAGNDTQNSKLCKKKLVRKQLAKLQLDTTTISSVHTASPYNGESSPSSETIEYHDPLPQNTEYCVLTRPSFQCSQSLKSSNSSEDLKIDLNSSMLSRCSFDNNYESNESNDNNEQQFIVSPISSIDKYIPFQSELSKQLRMIPKITRRKMTCSAKYTYHNVNTNDDDENSEYSNKINNTNKITRNQIIGKNMNHYGSSTKHKPHIEKYELSTSTTVDSSFQL